MTNKKKGATNALHLLNLIEKLSRFSVINHITDGFRTQSIHCCRVTFKLGDSALFDNGGNGLEPGPKRPARFFCHCPMTIAYREVSR